MSEIVGEVHNYRKVKSMKVLYISLGTCLYLSDDIICEKEKLVLKDIIKCSNQHAYIVLTIQSAR